MLVLLGRETRGRDGARALLDVDHTRQLLDAVEQQVALADRGLVLRVLLVGSVCLNDAADLIDLAVQPSSGDEARQLTVYASDTSVSQSVCLFVCACV